MGKFFYRVFCGFFLGLSVFAPGFSGSVIAIIMGIYQDILRIVSNPFKRFKENVLFCIPLGIGAVISAVLFLLLFRFLFDTYEKATYLLFVGLIAGNLPMIYSEIKGNSFKNSYLAGGIGAFAAALALGLSAAGVGHTAGAEALSTNLVIMALSGLAAGATTLIPGMSVSMVLIVIGVYTPIIYAAESLLHMDLTYLVPLGIWGVCTIVGLVLTSRGIKHVFEKFPGLANTMVFGFMSGSLVGVLVRSLRMQDAGFNWLLGAFMLAAGLAISMLFVVMGRTLNKE